MEVNRIPEAAYWAVIPADVRYDPELRPSAKLLYGELTSLSNKTGYCWATNEYFAALYGLSPSTVSRLITQLEKRGYIRCEIVPNAKGIERRIYAGAFVVSGGLDENVKGGLDEKSKKGLDENVKGGLDENVKQNNKELYIQVSNITPYSPPAADGVYDHAEQPPVKAKKSRAPKSVPDWRPDLFENFWDKYPGGGSRARAVRAWDELRPDDALIHAMAAGLKRQKASRMWQEGVGIPHASTWLNGRRWEDKIQEAVPVIASSSCWAEDPEVTE